MERAGLTWLSPGLTPAAALQGEWCRAASPVSGALARAGMPTVPGLPRRSCPGCLSTEVSGRSPRGPKWELLGLLSLAWKSHIPAARFYWPKQIKGQPRLKSWINKLHPWKRRAAKHVRLFVIHHMMWEEVALPGGESAILGSTKSLCRKNRAK